MQSNAFTKAFLRTGVLALFCLVMWGCQTPPPPPQFINATANDQKLIELTRWQFRGRLAFKSEQETFSANVRWQQNEQDTRFILTNVVGITLLELHIEDGITRIQADGEEYTGTDAQQLIEQISGWQIPLTQMLRWVKGLAQSNELSSRADNGLLKHIVYTQNMRSWTVDYQRFTQANGIALPRQLSIKDDNDVSIRLKVNEWTIN